MSNQASSAASDRNIQLSDITTNNASTSKHGFLNKLSSTSSEFINGAGNWVNPMTVLSNPYKFVAYRNAAWNTPNATEAKITFDAESFDTNNNFASGTYTAPVAGFYYFHSQANWSSSVNNCYLSIYKNGASVKRGSQIVATNVIGAEVSAMLQLAANDTIDIYCFTQAVFAGTTGADKTWVEGHLISIT